MKRYASFALVVCLLVLAVAVVLGVASPSMQQAIVGCLSGIVERIRIIFQHLGEGLHIAFGPR